MYTKLEELKKKYNELGQEIARLEKERDNSVGYKNDPIFLLSIGEFDKYKQKCEPIGCDWWLRASNSVAYPNSVAYVADRLTNIFDEEIHLYHAFCGYNFGARDIAIRPAVKLSRLSKGRTYGRSTDPFGQISFRDYVTFVGLNEDKTSKMLFLGITWTRINDDLYISETPIAFDKFDNESIDYETSHVRKFLLQWFSDRLEMFDPRALHFINHIEHEEEE